MTKVSATINGEEREYFCDHHITLLNQALEEGIEIPFSCMSGACTTCKAKLVAGDVEMADHSSLGEDEVAEGWILTCQAMPRSDVVRIEVE